jgi:cation diffusion facilitator family transporter
MMQTPPHERHIHSHTFGQDRVKTGERRTVTVIFITALMMIVEVAAGMFYGSMALLADGLHMASHAFALGITWYAYVFARKHAHDRGFSFGTGKVNSLAAFASALLLAGFAVMMAWESIIRFLHPVVIAFDQAILVAFIGLLVNAISVFILGVRGEEGAHKHDYEHHHDHHKDHNLRAAYLHVLADALTSLLAIFALMAGKYFGLNWMDPVMGVVGSILVARWSWGLLREASRVLLDKQASEEMLETIKSAVERGEHCKVTDLHVWEIGPGIVAVQITVLSTQHITPEQIKALLPKNYSLAHVAIEVNSSEERQPIR